MDIADLHKCVLLVIDRLHTNYTKAGGKENSYTWVTMRHLQIQHMKDHTYDLSSEKWSLSPKTHIISTNHLKSDFSSSCQIFIPVSFTEKQPILYRHTRCTSTWTHKHLQQPLVLQGEICSLKKTNKQSIHTHTHTWAHSLSLTHTRI